MRLTSLCIGIFSLISICIADKKDEVLRTIDMGEHTITKVRTATSRRGTIISASYERILVASPQERYIEQAENNK